MALPGGTGDDVEDEEEDGEERSGASDESNRRRDRNPTGSARGTEVKLNKTQAPSAYRQHATTKRQPPFRRCLENLRNVIDTLHHRQHCVIASGAMGIGRSVNSGLRYDCF